MKSVPKFKLREGREPKREEDREARKSKSQLKRLEVQEGRHFPPVIRRTGRGR